MAEQPSCPEGHQGPPSTRLDTATPNPIPGERASAAEAPGGDEAPPVIRGYRILGELGGGGMGKVYKAHHEPLGRTVALKVIRAGRADEPGEVARFRKEAEAMARLRHPHIVPVYEVGRQANGRPYFTMEWVE